MLVQDACRFRHQHIFSTVSLHEPMADEAMVNVVHSLVFCVRKALAVPWVIKIVDYDCGLLSRLLEYEMQLTFIHIGLGDD